MAIALPSLIELNNYAGDTTRYFDAVYAVFVKDFVTTVPTFRGVRLGLKKHPIVGGREYTFYHMTHSGQDEQNRQPDMRRMERMPWPRPIIDFSHDPDLKVWENVRRGAGGTKSRILIWDEINDYLVILDKRNGFILPWTAYCGLNSHKRRRLEAEYRQFHGLP